MKSEIQKILEMNKSGTITDAQAAQLIEEISVKQQAAREVKPAFGRPELSSKWTWGVREAIDSISSAMKGAKSSSISGVFLSDIKDNVTSMSRIELPREAEGSIFKDNEIHMSNLRFDEFVQSELSQNAIASSNFEKVSMRGSTFSRTAVQSSAVEKVRLMRARIDGSMIRASRFAKVSLEENCEIQNLKVRSSTVKELSLSRGSTFADSAIEESEVAMLGLESASIRAMQIDSSEVSRVQFVDSRLKDVLFRGVHVRGLTLNHCEFADVLFSAGEGWKRRRLEDVTFENCKFDKALFTECRWVRCVIRNVTLMEAKSHQVELVDQTIDGNDAFLRAIMSGK